MAAPYISLSEEEIPKVVEDSFPYYKYPEGPRKYQLEYIIKALKAFRKYKYVAINAPTGAGKSCIAFTVSKIMNKYGTINKDYHQKTFFTVPYITLQNQYCEDFEEMEFIKGTSNYTCVKSGSDCATAPCRMPVLNTKVLSAHYSICMYAAAKRAASACPMTLFNITSFLTFLNYTQVFDSRKLLICDEAHTLERVLCNFITVNFSSLKLAKFGIFEIPKFNLPSEYMSWMMDLKDILAETYEKIKKKTINIRVKDTDNIKNLLSEQEFKLFKIAVAYLEKINIFEIVKEELDSNFVVNLVKFSKGNQTIEFKPVMVDKFAHKHLFAFSECVLFLSATMYKDSFCRDMGIKKEELYYEEIPSTFPEPKKRRPLFVEKRLGAFNYKNLQEKLPAILNRVEEITSIYGKVKGLINTHTFKICDYVLKNASKDLKQRLISHKGGTENAFGMSREEALEKHCSSSEPTILISPSMYEGIDLKDDLGRFGIICKIPFSSLVDPQIKRRMEIDHVWYQWQTVLKIIQAYGRIVRSQKDWGYSFILDAGFISLYNRCSYMFPHWVKEAIILKN